jgi:hypothetical protein
LGNNSIDFYLLQHWFRERDTSPVLYLWIEAIVVCSKPEAPSTAECSAIRQRLLLPTDRAIPMRPIACVVYEHTRKHYFVALLNHRRHHVAVCGKGHKVNRSHVDHSPLEWAGPNIWRNSCIIFGWDIPIPHPTWWAVDFKQVISVYLNL